MIDRFLTWIKEVFKRMFAPTDIKRVVGIEPAISQPMTEALKKWAAMYENKAPWLNEKVKSLQLPAAIAGEVARMATIELKVGVTGSARADYLAAEVEKILPRLREKVELGCALGGLVFKPYVSGGALAVDYAPADGVVPVRFDGSGRMVGVVFVDQRQVGDRYYTKFEHHDIGSGTIDTVTAGGQRVVEFEMDDAEKRRISRGFPGASINSEVKSGYIIRNYVLRSSTRDTLGQPAQLSEVPEWSGLKQRSIIPGIDRPLFAYFRYPQANNIDKTSPLGVSCYARADELIQQADTQWSDLMWEFKSGRRKMYVDNLAFGKDKDGNTIGPFDKDLYVALETPGSNIGDGNKLFEAWSPEFREAAIKSGLNAILRQIEFACGLAYGTISDPEVVAKTATEVATTRQRSYATVTDTQKALRAALDDLLYAMDTYATLYGLAPAGDYEAAYDFDDSVIVDKDAQMSGDRQAVGMGAMPKFVFLMRNYGLDEATAKKWIADTQAEQPQDMFGEQGGQQ